MSFAEQGFRPQTQYKYTTQFEVNLPKLSSQRLGVKY